MADCTTDDFILRFRREVADAQTVGPKLWSDFEAYGYASEAADALAKKTYAQLNTSVINIAAGQRVVPLPREMLNIRSVRMVALDRVLTPANSNTSMYVLHDDYGDSKTVSMFGLQPGLPSQYVRDFEQRALILLPPTATADQLEIQCTVTTCALEAGAKMPFVDEEEQRLMLHYMKWLAYAKQDADTLDLKRSNEFKQQYDIGVLNRESELRRYRRTPGVVQMEW